MCLHLLSVDDCLKMVALAGAAIAFSVGLCQYWKAQRWKRAEFLANEMRSFLDAPRVQRALSLIDWGSRRLPLLENPGDNEKQVLFTREMQALGLRPHTLLGEAASDSETWTVDGSVARKGFTEEEVAIRDCYDAFLDGLERFASYASTGLIDAPSLQPYIGYWIEQIASPAQDADDAAWCAALLTYVNFYKFEGVIVLFDEFKWDIRPTSPTYFSFLKRMKDQKLASQLANTVGLAYS